MPDPLSPLACGALWFFFSRVVCSSVVTSAVQMAVKVGITVSASLTHPNVISLTFSPEAPVRTKVEKTGREYLVLAGQHSIVAPMGRQKRGTDSGRGKDS